MENNTLRPSPCAFLEPKWPGLGGRSPIRSRDFHPGDGRCRNDRLRCHAQAQPLPQLKRSLAPRKCSVRWIHPILFIRNGPPESASTDLGSPVMTQHERTGGPLMTSLEKNPRKDPTGGPPSLHDSSRLTVTSRPSRVSEAVTGRPPWSSGGRRVVKSANPREVVDGGHWKASKKDQC